MAAKCVVKRCLADLQPRRRLAHSHNTNRLQVTSMEGAVFVAGRAASYVHGKIGTIPAEPPPLPKDLIADPVPLPAEPGSVDQRRYFDRFFRSAASIIRRRLRTSALKRATVSSDRASLCLASETTLVVPAARRRASHVICLVGISMSSNHSGRVTDSVMAVTFGYILTGSRRETQIPSR
jgi:hypothetical protein